MKALDMKNTGNNWKKKKKRIQVCNRKRMDVESPSDVDLYFSGTKRTGLLQYLVFFPFF